MNVTESPALHAANRVVPNIGDQIELIVCSLECRLLESLTPEQFTLVQQLVDATRILAENDAIMRVAARASIASTRPCADGATTYQDARHDFPLAGPAPRRVATA
ncbi:MAG: hypothetical protein IT305_00850 [Chloroflexi bacterium]|nr:hypothetical protein [Chloroflexota bacterium]